MQVRPGPPCQVLVRLLPPDPAASLQTTLQPLQQIAQALTQLAANNIKVCISLDASSILPSPSVLQKLAPVLQELDCTSVDDLPHAHAWKHITSSHNAALLAGAKNIMSLGLSHHQKLSFDMSLLAKFGNLQRLEVHLPRTGDTVHLKDLRRLSELHLTVGGHDKAEGIRCADILHNNAKSLMHVTLTADWCCDNTYLALLQLLQLHSFSFGVAQLSCGNAAVLAKLRPSQSMSITIRETGPALEEVLQELTSYSAHITHLSLHGCPATAFSGVETLQHLTSLTLVRGNLSGAWFQPQPWLQSFKLQDVHMQNTDLGLMVRSYPAVRILEFSNCKGLQFSQDAFCTIFQLPRLNDLCLDAVEGLSADRLHWMEAFLRSQQCIGMSQPRVSISLKGAHPAQNLCVSYKGHSVLSGVEFDEERPNIIIHKVSSRVLYSFKAIHAIFGSMRNELKDMFSSLQHAAQLDPVALLMAMAFVGIQARCLTMPTQQSEDTHVETLSEDDDDDDDHDDDEPHSAAGFELHGSYVGRTIWINHQPMARYPDSL